MQIRKRGYLDMRPRLQCRVGCRESSTESHGIEHHFSDFFPPPYKSVFSPKASRVSNTSSSSTTAYYLYQYCLTPSRSSL